MHAHPSDFGGDAFREGLGNRSAHSGVSTKEQGVRERGTEESEAVLLGRAQCGDGDAYAVLVLRYQEIAFRAAYFLLRDAAEAEDAVQDAFIRAYQALKGFRADAPFRPWLLEIVANTARNRRRSAGRRQNLVLKLGSPGRAATDGLSPEVAALAHEQREALLREVNELRDEDRLAIACRYFLDLSEAETAALIGVARGTVKSRLSRALGRLRERLLAQDEQNTAVAEVNRG